MTLKSILGPTVYAKAQRLGTQIQCGLLLSRAIREDEYAQMCRERGNYAEAWRAKVAANQTYDKRAELKKQLEKESK